MKTTLKRLSAVLGTVAVTASMASMAAFAAQANYCDKQDNKEAPYDGSYWVQPKKWGSETIDPKNYSGSAKITIDKKELTLEEAKKNEAVTISFNATGIQDKVSSVGFHILWDTRLDVQKQGRANVKAGAALADFSPVDTPVEDGLECWVASASGDYSYDGELFSMQFKFKDASSLKGGEIFPIGIRYQYDGTTGDLFYNEHQDAEGKLMMTYVFTQGIENGYIKISAPPTTQPVTTAPVTTLATTQPATTAPGTTAPGTTVPGTSAPGTTAAGTNATTAKPTPATTAKATTAKTTTKPKAEDAAKTGVAGVGVAAAGLAIAVGTAFVLRKKED